jgi:hypothetical protein
LRLKCDSLVSDYQKYGQASAYQPRQARFPSLLRLAVRAMFPAKRAELFQLQPFGGRALVLGLAVVPVFALGALELNDFSWHK